MDAKLHINNRVIIRYRERLSEQIMECVIEHVDDTYLIADVNSDHYRIEFNTIYEIKDYSYFERVMADVP